jgi:hypothetical protein
MSDQNHIRNPYRASLIPLTGLTTFFGLSTLLVFGIRPLRLAAPSLSLIGLIFTLFFGLVTVIILLLGLLQVRRIKSFLSSDRPLIRWTYSSFEEAQLKEQKWQAERHDWQIQWGCLTVLIALAGLLTGVMVGGIDGWLPALGSGLVGLLIGGLVGGVLGALVAGGNRLALAWTQRDDAPQSVALGVGEIYANGDYFKADNRFNDLQSARLIPGNPVILEVHLRMQWRVRMPDEETWQIPVPASRVETVEAILPRLLSIV